MDLRNAVTSIFGASPEGAAVRHLVEESHRLALAYLRQRSRVGTLEARRFGLSLEDLALDCIADLFRRDEKDCFVQLTEYFESVGWQEKDLAGLRIALRRLVFSKVNEGLFRRHRNHDPELARIIRNVKNAVKADAGLSLMRRGRELWMVIGDPAQLGEQPPIPFETLEAHFVPILCKVNYMPDIVASFKELLDVRTGYAPGYPVSRFSMAVRAASLRLDAVPEPVDRNNSLTSERVEQAIRQSTDEARAEMFETYVASKKMNAHTFEQYVHATRDILCAQFSSAAPPVTSYYHALKVHVPALCKEEYRQHHRHILEYIVKTSRARLIASFQDGA